MAIIEVVSGGDRRSLMKRFERKSKQQAISELVDFHLLNCARIEKLEAERDAALARVAELELKLDTSDYAYDSDRSHIRGLAARAIARAKVFDDGSDGADAESARSVVAILRELLAVGPAPVAQAQHSVPEGLAEFSQFLSAVMDAAGLVRYGRRSKELSEYLGAQCMK
ncbi:hypothetical protein, partial [Pseudomonas aeruginosa]